MTSYLLVGLGSALGGMARFYCAEAATRAWGTAFPWGTLIVNVAGSFAIGVLAGLLSSTGKAFLSPSAQQVLIVGFLGGYTTFSAFSLQTLGLMREGLWLRAGANVGASVVLCLAAVALGHWVAGVLNQVQSAD